MHRTRSTIAVLTLVSLIATPLAAGLLSDCGLCECIRRTAIGLATGLEEVGWVLVPLLVLAVAVMALALHQVTRSVAGIARLASPSWISPACESALLLGMLGTMIGMFNSFLNVSPDQLDTHSILVGLGAALRSSVIGFLIALVGLWLQDPASDPAPSGELIEPGRNR